MREKVKGEGWSGAPGRGGCGPEDDEKVGRLAKTWGTLPRRSRRGRSLGGPGGQEGPAWQSGVSGGAGDGVGGVDGTGSRRARRCHYQRPARACSFVVMTTLSGRHCHCPRFAHEGTEAWRGETSWPGSLHQHGMKETGLCLQAAQLQRLQTEEAAGRLPAPGSPQSRPSL